MKTKKNFFYMIAILICLSCSETNTNELDNNELIQKSQNINLNKLKLDEQKEYFRTITTQERLEIWNDKIRVLIDSCLDKDEEDFLENFLNEINDFDFTHGLSNQEYDEKWSPKIEALKSRFNWSSRDVYITFTTLYTVKFNSNTNKSANRIQPTEPTLIDEEPGLDSDACDCRWGGLGCAGFDCIQKDTCPDEPDAELGCGFMGFQSCTGKCDVF